MNESDSVKYGPTFPSETLWGCRTAVVMSSSVLERLSLSLHRRLYIRRVNLSLNKTEFSTPKSQNGGHFFGRIYQTFLFLDWFVRFTLDQLSNYGSEVVWSSTYRLQLLQPTCWSIFLLNPKRPLMLCHHCLLSLLWIKASAKWLKNVAGT